MTDDPRSRSALQPAGQGIHRKRRAPRPPEMALFSGDRYDRGWSA